MAADGRTATTHGRLKSGDRRPMHQAYGEATNDDRHLHAVTSGEAAAVFGSADASPGALAWADGETRPTGAGVPDLTLLIHRKPSIGDLADMQALAEKVLPRGHEALVELEQALTARDPLWSLAAARRLMSVGLVAGDLSRSIEGRLP